MRTLLRRILPPPLRHAINGRLAEIEARRVSRRLRAIGAGHARIVAGPWLGEVGFELLYWVPFLRWFAKEFDVPPARLVAVSRGGAASWYEPFAGTYLDVLDYASPDELKDHHGYRLRELGEQKQRRITPFEQKVLAAMRLDGSGDALLHPSEMYRLFNPFWWRHTTEAWVHRRAIYAPLIPPHNAPLPALPPSFAAVKFYFNDCFPETGANVEFARETVRALVARSPVVSLAMEQRVDDHTAVSLRDLGVISLQPGAVSQNLHLQSAVVARASVFVGTYGGFSYLAPFYGVRSVAYYDDASAFSPRHLAMAHSVLSVLGTPGLLETHPARRARGLD
jgi:hypothetical protein